MAVFCCCVTACVVRMCCYGVICVVFVVFGCLLVFVG